jgi:hypothetical protein
VNRIRLQGVDGLAQPCRPSPLLIAHETPGDPLARGLPSPVCTGRAASQSRWQETMTDRGEYPAQRWYTMWFAITNVHRLLAAFPTLTSVVCCPSAAFRWVTCLVGDAPSGPPCAEVAVRG